MKLCKFAFGIALSCVSASAFAQSTAPASKPATSTQPAAAASAPQTLTPEQEKAAKNMLKQTMKAFADASLTSEQEQKAEAIFSKATKEVVAKRSAAKITPELQKKQAAAAKEARESGKKGKKQAEAAFASAGFNEEQIKVFKETQETLNKAKREFAKTLKPEQIQKLPDNMQKMLSKAS